MDDPLERLASVGSPALSINAPRVPEAAKGVSRKLVDELVKLLDRKNGFYAFESALHVFTTQSARGVMDLAKWNSLECWICNYGDMIDSSLFFAEDVFGGQFCIKSDGVYYFDPEIGEFEFFEVGVREWANRILEDYRVHTGYPVAHSWQEKHGALPAGKRLIPKLPFVTGGEFVADNMYAIDSVRSMQLRANLALQIRGLPDGATISWKILE